MRFFRFESAVVAAVMMSPVAWAGGGESTAEERFISPTAATSNCIGDPVTPLCAVETRLACALRRDMRLCERVGVPEFLLPEEMGTLRYRVISQKTIRTRDVTRELRNTDWFKPGYVDVTIKDSAYNGEACQEHCITSFITKPVAQGWHVVTWAVWGVD